MNSQFSQWLAQLDPRPGGLLDLLHHIYGQAQRTGQPEHVIVEFMTVPLNVITAPEIAALYLYLDQYGRKGLRQLYAKP